jgi:hypothetical protein
MFSLDLEILMTIVDDVRTLQYCATSRCPVQDCAPPKFNCGSCSSQYIDYDEENIGKSLEVCSSFCSRAGRWAVHTLSLPQAQLRCRQVSGKRLHLLVAAAVAFWFFSGLGITSAATANPCDPSVVQVGRRLLDSQCLATQSGSRRLNIACDSGRAWSS